MQNEIHFDTEKVITKYALNIVVSTSYKRPLFSPIWTINIDETHGDSEFTYFQLYADSLDELKQHYEKIVEEVNSNNKFGWVNIVKIV